MIRNLFVWLTGLLLLTLVPAAGAQPWGRPDFSPQNLLTVKGTLALIQEQSGMGPGGGHQKILMLSLKTPSGIVAIHLGPPLYFQQEKITFTEGETLEVTGARLATPSGLMLLATQVKQGERLIKLRDEQGNPVWQGQRLGRPQP